MPIPLKEPVNAFGIFVNFYWTEVNPDQIEKMKLGIDLSEKLNFKLLTQEEVKKLGDLLPSVSDLFGSHPKLYPSLVLNDVNIGLYFSKEYHEIKKALLAFRLLKSGEIFIENIYNVFHNQKLLPVKFSNLPSLYWEGLYEFSFDEIKDLSKIYKQLQNINFDKYSSIKIACDRFDKSYYNLNPEDKLIDLCIGFESLFCKGEHFSRMGQTIGLACSMLLGQNNKERNRIQSLLIKSFKARNDIVHGMQTKIQVSKIIQNFEDYLRKSILRLLPE